MKKLIWVLAFVFFLGCGSQFIEHPGPAPDLTDCEFISREVYGSTFNSPFPMPFDGGQQAVLYTKKPLNWDDFEGKIHLTGIEWNVDWAKRAAILVEGIAVAIWSDGYWETYPNLDLRPYLHEHKEDWLRVEVFFKGKGIKPRGQQTITSTMTLALCGNNAALIY